MALPLSLSPEREREREKENPSLVATPTTYYLEMIGQSSGGASVTSQREQPAHTP